VVDAGEQAVGVVPLVEFPDVVDGLVLFLDRLGESSLLISAMGLAGSPGTMVTSGDASTVNRASSPPTSSGRSTDRAYSVSLLMTTTVRSTPS